jgi:adenosylcobinamide-GDP ribazoletransferase
MKIQPLLDLKICAMFLTRLPLRHEQPVERGDLARALWSAPLLGGAIGAVGGAIYVLTAVLHLPPLAAAAIAIAATMALTGALHEDGLADVADGFGGGSTRERKLEIMRDSRIGTYGVCALILSLLVRISCLASIEDTGAAVMVLVCAGAAARAGLPAFMMLIPPARTDGMSAHAGLPPLASAVTAAVIGVAAVLGVLGLPVGIFTLVALATGFFFLAWLCRRQIGGQTGDVLGTLEQIGEVTILLIAASVMSS